MNGPIYQPTGRAGEYGDYAINIYTGCPHGCYYCYAARMSKRFGRDFTLVEPKKNIVEAVRHQLEKDKITGKRIHLCFTCDPYPTGYDTSATREVIKLLKAYGNHVQILTKGDGSRDFDLLDENDWYGITISGQADDTAAEPRAERPRQRFAVLKIAKFFGIKTWVSFEPVLDDEAVIRCITRHSTSFDKVKIGKLNYHASDIDWKSFGRKAEALCQKLGLDYYIKESLRKEMEK